MYTTFVCEINEIPSTKIVSSKCISYILHSSHIFHLIKHYNTSFINTYMFKFLDIVHTKSANTNPERSISHQYYTRSKARAMAVAEDPAARVECLEKAHLELQEKHAKSCDDISQMTEMLKMLTKEKQSAGAPNLQTETTPLRCTSEDILYPQGFALPRETPNNICFTISSLSLQLWTFLGCKNPWTGNT